MALPKDALLITVALIVSSLASAQETAVPDKQELARRIERLGKEAADIIRQAETKVERFQGSFFTRGDVYQATNPAPHRPIVFTFGVVLPEYAVMLPMNPEGFMELASHAGVDVRSDENRLVYGQTFLLATRDFRKRFRILSAASDIDLIPNPTSDEKKSHEELVNRFKEKIHKPKLAAPGSPKAIFFALIGQDLFEITLKIADDGRIQRSDALLATALPIAVAK